MTPEKPLFWHQGLFLQPQHFQHYDRYVRSIVSPAFQYILPYFWGTRNFEVNESALLNKVVEITDLDAVFEDNTWIGLGKNCFIKPRSFAEIDFDFSGKEIFTVYLGLKRWDNFSANVTQVNIKEMPTRDTRYLVDETPAEVKDLHAEGGSPAHISFLEHNVKIFWPHEVTDNNQYIFLPVAQLEMRGEEVCLVKKFIPPTFLLSGSSALVQIIKHIREQLLARCRVLETYKPSQSQSASDLEPASLLYIFALGFLNRYLAILTHILETPASHPWSVYCLLREMIAELSCFSDRVDGLGQLRDGKNLLPAYNHTDLNSCFSETQKLVVELLSSIVVGSENVIPLARDEHLFSCEIPSAFFARRSMFCLMFRSEEKDQQFIDSIVRHVKVGNCMAIETLIARSLQGVPLIFREVPPLGMARHSGRLCFEVDTTDHLWKDVASDGRFCLYWEAAPADTAIDLVVTKL